MATRSTTRRPGSLSGSNRRNSGRNRSEREARTCSSLNSANCIVQHVQELEKQCEKLLDNRFSFMEISERGYRASFVRFLEKQVRFYYANRKLRKEHDAREAKQKESL